VRVLEILFHQDREVPETEQAPVFRDNFSRHATHAIADEPAAPTAKLRVAGVFIASGISERFAVKGAEVQKQQMKESLR